MNAESVTFKILTDPRTADLIEDWVNEQVERHDFLLRMEMIKNGYLVSEQDAHVDFLGSA